MSASPTQIESTYPLIRIRFVYSRATIFVVIAGMASRRYRGQLPAFLAEYAGDTLWALMLFLLVSTLLAGRPILTRAAGSLAYALLVEISPIYCIELDLLSDHQQLRDKLRQAAPHFASVAPMINCTPLGYSYRCHGGPSDSINMLIERVMVGSGSPVR